MDDAPNALHWMGSSRKDLMRLPEDVQDVFAHALRLAQNGEKHSGAKPFKVRQGGGVYEVVEDEDGDTYRAVYTVRFKHAVYVLHAFQKKSKQGKKTPKQDVDLIEHRLKAAAEDYKAWQAKPRKQ